MPIINLQGYDIELPSPPKDKTLIFGYERNKAEQYWRRPYALTDNDYEKLSDARRREVEDTELERCTKGFWFYNNGEATWLPGAYYFFLTHWTIDGKHPYFIRQQLLNAYFRHHCKNDPKCYGWFVLKPRRAGETQEEISDMLIEAMLTFDGYFGIQSKTGDDAKLVNFHALTKGFEKLPLWMKPMTKGVLGGGKKELVFDRPTTQASNSNQKKLYNDKIALRTRIDWKTTVENAYDGSKLKRVILDEIGKWHPTNAVETWQIVKLCITDGFDLIGKAALLSTIGETDQAAADNFKKIWEASDYHKLNDNGTTESGLYRWFIPAWSTLRGTSPITGKPIVDKYGVINEAEAIQILLNERKGIKDPRKLAILIKQKPLTWQEALDFGGTGDLFDKIRITEREREIDEYVPPQGQDDFCRRGNFDWAGGIRFTTVNFIEHPEGRFIIHPAGTRLFGLDPNRVKKLPNGQYAPYSDTPFIFGVDPVDFNIDGADEDDQYSKFAIKGKGTVNAADPDKSHVYVLEYLERLNDQNDSYEDLLKAAWYFGAKINAERQKAARMFEYFRSAGCPNFFLKRPEITKGSAYKDADNRFGTPATDEIWHKGIEYLQAFIAPPNLYLNENQRDYLKDFWFRRTLAQWKNFSYAKKKKYDLVAADVQCEIGCRSVYHNPNKKDTGLTDLDRVVKAFAPEFFHRQTQKKEPVKAYSS